MPSPAAGLEKYVLVNGARVLQVRLTGARNIHSYGHTRAAQRARQVAQWQPNHIRQAATQIGSRPKLSVLNSISAGFVHRITGSNVKLQLGLGKASQHHICTAVFRQRRRAITASDYQRRQHTMRGTLQAAQHVRCGLGISRFTQCLAAINHYGVRCNYDRPRILRQCDERLLARQALGVGQRRLARAPTFINLNRLYRKGQANQAQQLVPARRLRSQQQILLAGRRHVKDFSMPNAD